METEVIMKREFMGEIVSQKSKNEFLSLTDLVRIGNKFRALNNLESFSIDSYFRNKGTKEFCAELERRFGKIKINSTGKNRHTWVHPFLFLDVALSINPNFKIEMYQWVYDSLLQYRNESGDSYKKMAGALWQNHGNKQTFSRYISDVADKIRLYCGVFDWNKANQDQLKMRDRIHENIFLLCDVLRDNDRAVELGIKRTEKQKEIAA